MRQAYIRKRLSDESMVLLDHCITLLDRFNITMTVRQLYYQLVAADLIPNNIKSYRRVVRILKDGRMCGLLDWHHIEDRLRVPSIPFVQEDIREMLGDAKEYFTMDRWKYQREYIEIWVEKDALAGICGEVCFDWQVPFQVNRGYSSVSAMRQAAVRVQKKSREVDSIIIGYLGDHDPSGEDMVRDVRDRLSLFGADVEIIKLAILPKDIKRFNLPPQPVKNTDSRSASFRMAHGEDCVELDALRPDVLRERIKHFVMEHLDRQAYDEVIEEEEEQKTRVKIYIDEEEL